MNKVILVALILIFASCNQIKKTDACSCEKIKTENDCKLLPTCGWTAATPPATGGTCAKPTTPVIILIKSYCENVTPPNEHCWKTVGCAYADAKCTHFTGCTAYVKTNDADCQAISKSCTSDGVTCIATKSCAEYTTSALCGNSSNSGTGKCKWDTTGAGSCRNYTCSEGDATNTTDALCNTYLAGCVTNGKGCVTSPRPACATYLGDTTTCAGYKGSDGNCEGVTGGTNCRARVCTGASATNTTNALCAEYQTGCITSGKGCVASPLPACSTYAGDATTCVGYNGSDGVCEGDAAGTACRGRNCTNAPSSTNTDALCVAYKSGCVTTGKGCVATSRGACSGYTGTSTTCVGFQGSDGYCKGTSSTTVGACSPIVCTEAAATLNTDAACAAYQIGCRTTGKGCIATLGACSSYNGTATSCDGYVGTDGKCKGSSTTSAPCAPKVCSEAPITLASNTECANYQTGCVTNGTGCVAITSCSNSVKQLSCTGTTGCGWQNSCLAITLCSDFITIGTCSNHQAGLTAATKKPCYWTGSACRDLACTDASTTFNTDSQCNTHLAGCLTNARGCVAPTAPCSNYQGTQTVCANFTKKCWNIDTAVATTVCLDRTCAHDVTSTTDGACISFLSTCLTKGAGCIEKSALCTAYQGTQATCNGFKGNNQVDLCYNIAGAAATAFCTVKQCADNTTATSDTDCGTFLTGCLWNGATGCLDKSAACTAYTGTTTTCPNYKGMNQTVLCWSTSATASGCVTKTCAHAAATVTTDTACKEFLSSCLTNGAGCVDKTAGCSTYSGNDITCLQFTGNSKRCQKKGGCGDRTCADITNAANQASCDAYMPTACQAIGMNCVNKAACNTYTALATQCQSLTGTDGACWSTVGQSGTVAASCTLKTCSSATSPTGQTDCTNWKPGCRFSAPTSGKVCVDSTTNCSGISGTSSECQSMTGADGACWSQSAASVTVAAACVLKDCSSIAIPSDQAACTSFLAGCRFSAPAAAKVCVATTTNCSGLQGTPTQCQSMTGNDGKCWSAVSAPIGAQACVLATCSLATQPADANACTNFTTQGCRLSKPASGSICVDLFTPCALLVGLPAECEALKGMDGQCWSQHSASTSVPMSCILKECNLMVTVPTNQSSCDTFMPSGCTFNGNTVANCLPIGTACGSLFGTGEQCKAWNANNVKCWPNAGQTGTTIAACKERSCSDASSPTSQSDCTTHLAGCLYTSTPACLDSTTKCSGLTLTASLCKAATASDGPCWSLQNASNSLAAACVSKQCFLTDAPTNLASCTGFMSGCLFTKTTTAGICRSPGTNCTSLWGTASECQALTGSDTYPCWSAAGASSTEGQACIVAPCANIPTPPNQAFCQAVGGSSCFLTRKSAGVLGCLVQGNCSTYSGTGLECQSYTGLDGKCSRGSAGATHGACKLLTVCADITPAAATDASCQSFLPNCFGTKLSSSQPACKSSGVCSSFSGTPAECQTYTADDGKCVGASVTGGHGTCKLVSVCDDILPATATNAGCTALLANCFVTKTSETQLACKTQGDCATYGGTVYECQKYVGTDGICGGQGYSYTSYAACALLTQCDQLKPAALTNEACLALRAGCYATQSTPGGIKCRYSNGCQVYSGTARECQEVYLINFDGRCTGTKEGFGSCKKVSTCADIYPYGTTDVACTSVLANCFLTRSSETKWSCQSQGNCSTYNGTALECHQYTGTDGKCAGATVGAAYGSCVLMGGCTTVTPADATNGSCTVHVPTNCFVTLISATQLACQAQGNCSTYNGTALECQAYTGSDGRCVGATAGATYGACKQLVNCTDVTPTAFSDASCTAIKAGCFITYTSSTDKGCISQGNCSTYNGTQSNCRLYTGSDGKCTGFNVYGACYKFTTCSLYSNTVTKCQELEGTDGPCWNAPTHSSGTANCVLKTCGLKSAPTQLSDCNGFITGCLLSKPAGGNICVPSFTLCSGLHGLPSECQTFVSFKNKCWSAVGASATIPAPCIIRTCEHKSAPNNLSDCTTHLSSCLLSQPTSGNICVPDTTKCQGLTGTPTQCQSFTGFDGPCYSALGAPSTASACVLKTCELKASPTSQSDCNTFIPGCKFSREVSFCTNSSAYCAGLKGVAADCQAWTGKDGVCWSAAAAPVNTIQACVLKSTLACADFTGDGIFCNSLTQTDGRCHFSGASASVSAACKLRVCTDDAVSTTDAQCSSFLANCKTKGTGCIASTTPCSTFVGTSTTCSFYTSTVPTNKCKFGSTSSGACEDKTCYDEVTSTSNQVCELFLAGCVTKGIGCVPNTVPCTDYYGTQTACSAFVGSSGTKKCWNSAGATATTACKERICTDDTSSTTNDACAVFLTGCITKGTGCVPPTSPCSAFSGNTATCNNFKGLSGTKQCWNLSTASSSSSCIDKLCIHNTTSTTDADCAAFMPQSPASAPPLCVTNGAGCVDYPRACSAFTGSTEVCGKFKANDGPCKSSVLIGSGACTPRVCSEALNNLITDTLCKAWHPSCVTSGYGCVTSTECSGVAEVTSCNAKTGCGWLDSCQTIGANCSSLTALGRSICMNTPITTGLICAWFNNTCRERTCEDLSANLTTDASCAALIPTCTTNGQGCITKTVCSAYLYKPICEAAKTTSAGDTCIWDTNSCRPKKCSDAPSGSITNDSCNRYLATCRTNGIQCIEANTNCNAIKTQVACLKDGLNQPCLWINGVGNVYAKCEDVSNQTHTECQKYSPQCTTNGTNCIPINSCAKTTLPISCVVGVDGKCGWLPAVGIVIAKCQKFGECPDAIGTTLATCNAYDSTCITDGVKCIAKVNCSSYQTMISCQSNGTDGVCQWLPSGTDSGSCRLRECSDATVLNSTSVNTFQGCYAFTAKTKCSTDGTKCIPLAACSTYTEAGCEQGTDGICIYALAVGTTSGTKACRTKVCTDFEVQTSVACSTALTGAGAGTGCVFNGTNCIAKAACSTYNAREACNGGGTDGICAFTAAAATTPNVGTCKLMTACTDANNDQFACSLKSAQCKFTSSTTGTTTTTTCAAQTCVTAATGTLCNPVLSFDSLSYSICVLTNGVCAEGDGTLLNSNNCFTSSVGTYTWNADTSRCESCFITTIDVDPISTTTDGGTSYTQVMQALFGLLSLIAMFS